MLQKVEIGKIRFHHAPWRTLQDHVRETGAEGGINAGFFDRHSTTHPHGSKVLGMVAWDGKSAVDHGYDRGWWDPAAFWHGVVKRKGSPPKIEVSPRSNWGYAELKDIDWAIGMGPIVLYSGHVQVVDGNRFPGVNPVTRTQRIGFGLSQELAFFAYLPNATAVEMGMYLYDNGAVDGILADGGSSASYFDGINRRGSQLVPNTILWDNGDPVATPVPTILGDEINEVQLSENFNLMEFQCRHCGSVMIDPELVRRLQQMRDRFRRPIVITSGYRCPTHNRAIGGVPGGQHERGTAADIRVVGIDPNSVAAVAESYFSDGGLGRYRTHTHVDTRGSRARWDRR